MLFLFSVLYLILTQQEYSQNVYIFLSKDVFSIYIVDQDSFCNNIWKFSSCFDEINISENKNEIIVYEISI